MSVINREANGTQVRGNVTWGRERQGEDIGKSRGGWEYSEPSVLTNVDVVMGNISLYAN